MQRSKIVGELRATQSTADMTKNILKDLGASQAYAEKKVLKMAIEGTLSNRDMMMGGQFFILSEDKIGYRLSKEDEFSLFGKLTKEDLYLLSENGEADIKVSFEVPKGNGPKGKYRWAKNVSIIS